MNKTLLAIIAILVLPGCITSALYNATLAPDAGYHVRLGSVVYIDYENGIVRAQHTKKLDADSKTFQVLKDGDRDPYAKDKDTVWFMGRELKGADAESFEALAKPFYAKDKNHVYYMGRQLEDESPEKFEP